MSHNLNSQSAAENFQGLEVYEGQISNPRKPASSALSRGWSFVVAKLPVVGICSALAVLVPLRGAAVTAMTLPVTGVTNGLATLSASVNPQSAPTSVWFEWGLMDLFNNATTPTNIGSGATVVPVSAELSGLTSGLTYRVRVAASFSNGVVRGVALPFGEPVLGFTESGPVTSKCEGVELDSALVIEQTPAGIAAGGRHSVVLRADGSLVAWGDNSKGQTNVPTADGKVVGVSAGFYHGLALKNDGRVVGWGENLSGQTNVPTSVTNAVAVAAGYSHGIALRANGTIAGWGDNGAGQAAPPNSLSNAVAVAAGEKHSIALTSDGKVVGWGKFVISGISNPVAVPSGLSNVVAIAAGANHDLALRSDGTVVGWGNNNNAQIVITNTLSNVVAIAAGNKHSLALRANGTVVGWGDDLSGQATPPPGLSNVVAIAAGYLHSLAIQADGTVVAWGWNFYGQTVVPGGLSTLSLAAQQTKTSDMATSNGFVRIYTYTNAAGGVASASRPVIYTCAPFVQTRVVTDVADGSATFQALANPEGNSSSAWFEWGVMDRFDRVTAATNIGSVAGDVLVSLVQTGIVPGVTYKVRVVASNVVGTVRSFPVSFSLPGIALNGGAVVTNPCFAAFTDPGAYVSSAPAGLAAGAVHSLALMGNGSVTGWGGNASGQIAIPPALSNAVMIAAGASNSLAAMVDGSLVGWGDNFYGQSISTQLLTNVAALASGGAHSLALLTDGTVVNFGSTNFGLDAPSPAFNVAAIAAGGSHSVVLDSRGNIHVWGDDTSGQTNVPPGATNILAISAGARHSLAVKVGGSVVAWGDDADGQSTVPSGLTNAISVAAGSRHSLALLMDGTVRAWGNGSLGQTNVPPGLSNVVSIAAGHDHNLALLADGQIIGWGDDTSMQATVPSGLQTTSLAVSVSGSVDVNTPGLYVLQYFFTNVQGAASFAQRTVLVSCPPFASIQPVTNVLDQSATLIGLANPSGIPGGAWFEWGVAGLFNQATPVTNVGSGSVDVEVTEVVTGLVAGVAYQARLAASNASAVVRSLVVTFGIPGITLVGLSQAYDGSPRVVDATTAPTGLVVNITYDGSATAPVNAGSYAVTATVADVSFVGETNGTLVVSKGSQGISFSTPASVAATGSVELTGSATSGLEVTFAVLSGPGVLADGTNLTFTSAGDVLVVASQGGDTNWFAAPDVTNSITATKALASVTLLNLSRTFNGSAQVVNASTTPTGLAVNVTYNGGPTPPVNAGSYAVTGTVNDTTYQGVQSGTLSIDKAAQTVTFPQPPAQLTTNVVGLAATASSGLTVGFSILSGPGQISGGTNLTFIGTGSVAVIALQAGNSNWYPNSTTNFIDVTKAVAPITLHGLTQPYSGSPIAVTATTQPTGLTVVVTYDGGNTQPVGTGTYAIAATIDDAMYQGSQTGTLVITKGEQSVVFPNPGPQFTTNLVGLTAFVTSGLPVSFSVLSGAAQIADGTNLSFTGAGTVVVVAAHSGDTNWNPNATTNAILVTKSFANVFLDGLTQAYNGSPLHVSATTVPTGLIVNLTYDGITNAPASVGPHTVTGTVNDVMFQGVATGTLTITKGVQSLVFNPPTQTFRIASIGLSATASSGLPVTFALISGPGVLSSGTNLRFSAGGIVRVDATQAGSTNWDPVTTSAYISVRTPTLDFNGDGLSDIAVFTPATALWRILQPSGATSQLFFGNSGTLPFVADYDADGFADHALYQNSIGRWFIIPSKTATPISTNFGSSARIAVPADYDGDGRTDRATYLPSLGQWLIQAASNNVVVTQQWGWSASIPVPADYDGDGKTDIAVYHPVTTGSVWYVKYSGGGATQQKLGGIKTIPVPADYDGDGKADIAGYTSTNGNWYMHFSTGGSTTQNWGWSAAAPVPADYDGDGKADITVYHPSTGTWYVRLSSGGSQIKKLGSSTSVPVWPQFQTNRRYFTSP